MVQPQGSAPHISTGTLFAAVLVVTVLVAGAVVLAIADRETAAAALLSALALAIPVVLNLFKVDRIEQHAQAAVEVAHQTASDVAEVKEKVNGELRQQVIDAARAAGRDAVKSTAQEIRAAVKEAAVEETKAAIRAPDARSRQGDK